MISISIYSRQFWLICLSSLLFFASFNMIVPELPAYLTALGGAEYKGLIISLFTVTAMLSRPFSGKLADRLGRKPVIMFGSMVCLVCSLFYPILTTVSGFLLLRLIHGFSTGFTPTGQTALLSDLIPAERRGEAMGLLGTAGTLGMASGPALGGVVANQFGLNMMFYLSSACGLFAILILLNIKETLKEKHPVSFALLKIHKRDLFEPRVVIPCIIMVLCAYSYGAAFTVLPDFGDFLGIKNKGIIFTFFTISSLIIRLIGGKASDRFGRKPVLIVSSLTMTIGMFIIALADAKFMLLLGVCFYGLGQGATSPTLLAWATDLSNPEHKGRGIASLYIFMELGIGIGAFASGLIYGNDTGNFFVTFIVCSVLALLAFLYLIYLKTSQAKS
ncbi:MAG TPA: MFS transporter [Chryseosolibacter sp.]